MNPTNERVRIAFPTEDAGGMAATRCPHFGHAPYFTIVEHADGSVVSTTALANRAHEESGCLGPVNLLAEHRVDVVVVGGIGRGPLAGLARSGILVLHDSVSSDVASAIAAWTARASHPVDPESACGCSGH